MADWFTSPAAPDMEFIRYMRDTLLAEVEASAETEGSFRDQQDTEEDLYFQRFDIESPQGRLAVRTGSAPADADAAIDSISPTDIQVRVRPARSTESHRKRADTLARFGRALIAAWRRMRDPFPLLAADQVIRRVAVFRVVFDERMWPPIPEGGFKDDDDQELWETKHRSRIPILLERRNPKYTAWHLTEDGHVVCVVEHYRTTVLEARIAFDAYPETEVILAGRRAQELVWCSEVWYDRWRCVMIEDRPIMDNEVEEHGYLEPPYVIVPFRELPFEEMARRYRGMLSNAAGLYPIESQVLTMHVWQLAWNAWRTWIGWTHDGRPLRIVPGEFIPIDERRGEWVKMLEGESVPPELLQTAQIIGNYLQRNGVAGGPNTQEGTRSAQQVWAIQSTRQLKVEPAKQNLRRGIERALSLAAQILERQMDGQALTLPVPANDKQGKPIGEITVKSSDVAGYWDGFEVTFGARLDPALLEQAKTMMTFAMNNFMPRRVAWELSGLTESPEEWEDELTLQAIQDLDYMKELGGYELLKGEYGANSWETQNFAQRMQQNQPGGGQGGPQGGLPGPGSPAGGTMQPTAIPPGPAPGNANPMAPAPGASRAGGRFGNQPPANVPGGGMPGSSGPRTP